MGIEMFHLIKVGDLLAGGMLNCCVPLGAMWCSKLTINHYGLEFNLDNNQNAAVSHEGDTLLSTVYTH